jgi:hypothetical protein
MIESMGVFLLLLVTVAMLLIRLGLSYSIKVVTLGRIHAVCEASLAQGKDYSWVYRCMEEEEHGEFTMALQIWRWRGRDYFPYTYKALDGIQSTQSPGRLGTAEQWRAPRSDFQK